MGLNSEDGNIKRYAFIFTIYLYYLVYQTWSCTLVQVSVVQSSASTPPTSVFPPPPTHTLGKGLGVNEKSLCMGEPLPNFFFQCVDLRQGLSEPDFYGDLVYKLKKIVGSNNFSAQFIKIISHYKKIGYNINVLQQTACLVVIPITVGNFAFLFNCTPVGRTSDSMMVPT